MLESADLADGAVGGGPAGRGGAAPAPRIVDWLLDCACCPLPLGVLACGLVAITPEPERVAAVKPGMRDGISTVTIHVKCTFLSGSEGRVMVACSARTVIFGTTFSITGC